MSRKDGLRLNAFFVGMVIKQSQELEEIGQHLCAQNNDCFREWLWLFQEEQVQGTMSFCAV